MADNTRLMSDAEIDAVVARVATMKPRRRASQQSIAPFLRTAPKKIGAGS
jgi:hypothetical protein